MSDIVFACLHCGQSLAVEDSACGMTVECPKCLKQLVIPKASTECPPGALAEPSERPPLSRERKTKTPDDSCSGSRDHLAESPVAPKPGKLIIADKRLFTLVRLIVVIISLGMIFSIIMAGIHLQKIRHLLANHITYQDIQKAFQPAATTAQSQKPKLVTEIKFSDNIKKYYPGRNSRELLEWLEKTDPERRADFVANLAAVIKEAETQKAPDMRAVIAEYQRQKRLTPDFRATDVYSARPTILALISFVAFLIGMLLAFFCLLLILLAAEKKTQFHQEPMEQ
ncbi:MAG: hypothetical protein KJ692_02800 [Verrucomicrobia bacterium]|nr:hypothetical protein [Verrucomicrobiota bacterium]